MSVELNTVVQEVVIDDRQATASSARVVDAMESMAVASDKVTAANTRQASGFAALDAAVKASTPAQESALKRLNAWKAQADPVEAALQRLSRAEQDFNRAISQGISSEAEKARNMELLWQKTLGAASAQEKLNAAQRAQNAQAAFNAQLGVRDDFGGAARAADIAAYGQELSRVQQKYAPLAAAAALYEREIEEITQAQKAGALTAQQAATALAMNEAGYKRTITSIQASQQAILGHTGAVKLQSWQVTNLGQQLQDVFVQMQMGANPFTILSQQGPQITTALGGVKNALALALQWINPVYVGLGLLAGGMAIVASRATDIEGETRKMSVALRAYGKDAEVTTGQIHKLIETMRDYGVAKADARLAASAAIAVPGAGNSAIVAALGAAPDFSAAFGVSIDDAAKKLTEMGTTGYAAIKKLDEAYKFLTVDQARLIRELSEHGDKAGAVAVAYQALEMRISGAALNAMSPMKRATTEMTRTWQDLVDTIANTQPVLDAINSLSGGFKTIAGVLSGDLTSAWDGWVDHVTNDPIFSILSGLGKGWLKLGAVVTGTSDQPISSSVMGGSGSAHSAPYRPASESSTIAASSLDAETAAYERQIKVLNSAAGARQIMQAQLEAENQAMIAGKNAVEIKTAGDRAASIATAQLATAANDNLIAIKAQTDGTLALATAGGAATEAGLRAQAEMQARVAKLQNVAVNERKLTDALIDQAKANAHLQAVEDLRAAKLNTQIAQAKAQSAIILDPNLRHQAELSIERQEYLNGVTEKYKGNVEDIQKAMREFDSKQIYDDQARYWNDVRQKAEDVSNDISQFLVDGFVNAEKGGQSAFRTLWDGALAGGKRFLANFAAEMLKQQFILPIVTQIIGDNSQLMGIVNAAAGMQGGGASGGAGATGGLGGLSSIASIGGLFKSGGTLSGIGSWVGGLFGGGASSATSAVSAATASQIAAGGASGSLAGATSGAASAAYAIPVWGWIAAAAAIAKSFVEGSDPKSAKGALNTLLAPSIDEWMAQPRRSIANAMDPLGTMLTDFGLPSFLSLGGIVGSLLGMDKQPSNKYASVPIDAAAGTLGKLQYDPSEYSKANADAAQALGQGFIDIQKQILALTGGTGPNAAFATVGSRDGITVGIGNNADFWKSHYGGQPGVVEGTFTSPEKALDFLIQQLAKQISGVTDADYKRILAMGGSAQTIIDNLNVAAQIKSLSQGSNVSAASDQLKELNQQFADLRTKALALGLAVTDLDKAQANQLRSLSAGVKVNFTSTVQQFIGQYLDPLKALQASITTDGQTTYEKFTAAQSLFRDVASKAQQGNDVALGMLAQAGATYADLARNLASSTEPLRNFLDSLNSGSLSNLTPLQQLDAARSKYEDLSGKVAAGDSSAISDLQAAAQNYLQIARDYGASGHMYQEAYIEVTTGLRALIDQIDGAIGSVDTTGVLGEIGGVIAPLIDELQTSQAAILAGIAPSLDDLNSNFRTQIDTLKDEGVQTRSLLAEIAAALGAVPQHATGGLMGGIGGPTSDSNLSWFSAGEYLVKASSVARFGVGFFDSLNDGHMPSVANSNIASGFTPVANDNSDIVRAIATSTGLITEELRQLREENARLRDEIAELKDTVYETGQRGAVMARK